MRNDTILSDLKLMSHLEIFQTIIQVKMNIVRVIATMLMLLVLALTYLFLFEDNLSSFLKLGFNIWHAFIFTECWIRFVHKSARRSVIELCKHWCCLTSLGIFMCVANYWTMTEEDLRKATVCGFTCYFVRLMIMVDHRDSNLDEDNEDDEPANRIAYRHVIQDSIQQLQDQQEFQERMN